MSDLTVYAPALVTIGIPLVGGMCYAWFSTKFVTKDTFEREVASVRASTEHAVQAATDQVNSLELRSSKRHDDAMARSNMIEQMNAKLLEEVGFLKGQLTAILSLLSGGKRHINNDPE